MVYSPQRIRKALALRGGDEIARQSLLGAGITTLLSTLSTGNPLAGLAVGGTDLLLSSAIGRAMAGKMVPTGQKVRVPLSKADASKLSGTSKTIRHKGAESGIALPGGGIRSAIPGLHGSYETKYLAPGAGGVTQRFKEQVAAGKSPWRLVQEGPHAGYYMRRQYNPSMAQIGGTLAGSIGATLAVEPMFYPQQATQAQQLAQMKYINDLNPNTAAGTLYQTQGIPMRFA